MATISVLKLVVSPSHQTFHRTFSLSAAVHKNYSCKLLVIGGGTGGCTIANKFARRLKKKDAVIILEPSPVHYYQPLWTLVGAGVKTLEQTSRSEHSLLPKKAIWLKDYAQCINPNTMQVTTANGDSIECEYMVVAVGLKNDYCLIPGLTEALADSNSGVSTIYSAQHVGKTWKDLQAFRGGDAIFTYPSTPIKCPGAPQKIAYLADSYLTKAGVRNNSRIYYNTTLPVIFGVKKYADALLKIVKRKDICVNYQTVLKEIDHERRQAVFHDAKDKTKITTQSYDMLHVTPPMSPPDVLKLNKELTDEAGYLDVHKYTLQHKRFPNIFGLGDCTNTPNSKTAAAISKQSYVLEHNLLSTMGSKELAARYDGYGACPLLTSYSTCILAEFLYDGVVHETFPFDQVTAVESTLAYYMKRDLFPFIYWNFMLKGYYHGPEFVRKMLNPLRGSRLFGKPGN